MIVLGIESSCDESAAAVVAFDRGDTVPRILSNVVHSQTQEHRPYGGVVPEIAARAHIEHLDGLVARAMREARLEYAQIDGIAATAGPGLIGGVLVGLMTGKGIALTHGKPLLAVNHLEGHALSVRLMRRVAFPYLLLLISGGHCQVLIVQGVGRYRLLGGTRDDAVGEAFDKTAKMLELGFPGGPAVEAAARTGRAARFALPRPLTGRKGCDFSFSGLKTAVRHAYEALPNPQPQDLADLAASFQAAVGDVLVDRCAHAMTELRGQAVGPLPFVAAGGVASNTLIRTRLEAACHSHGFEFIAPPPFLCTDNAAMIAWAGVERLAAGLVDDLDASPRARWPLEELKHRA